MRVLVTGAFGFIGMAVSHLLAQRGVRVIGMGRSAPTGDHPHNDLFEQLEIGEITQARLAGLLGPIDAVIHCAGQASVSASLKDPVKDRIANVALTADLLSAVAGAGFRTQPRLVFASSAAIYGHQLAQPILTDAQPQPTSPYGVHKLEAEALCRAAEAAGTVSLSIVRLFSIYGSGLRRQLLWDACRKLQTPQPQFMGTGAETRDWLHVQDAAELLVRSALEPSMPVTMNGGTGIGTRNRDLLETLARALNRRETFTFSGVVPTGDPEHLVADVSQVFQTGWEPAVTLTEGVKDYARWFRQLPVTGG
ncbi:MAG: NAD(P)-dependent oxidoreductase [Pseudomonadota bacterium]